MLHGPELFPISPSIDIHVTVALPARASSAHTDRLSDPGLCALIYGSKIHVRALCMPRDAVWREGGSEEEMLPIHVLCKYVENEETFELERVKVENNVVLEVNSGSQFANCFFRQSLIECAGGGGATVKNGDVCRAPLFRGRERPIFIRTRRRLRITPMPQRDDTRAALHIRSRTETALTEPKTSSCAQLWYACGCKKLSYDERMCMCACSLAHLVWQASANEKD